MYKKNYYFEWIIPVFRLFVYEIEIQRINIGRQKENRP